MKKQSGGKASFTNDDLGCSKDPNITVQMAVVTPDPDVMKRLLHVAQHKVDVSNNAHKRFKVLGGKPYMLNGELHSQDDVDGELRQLYASMSVKYRKYMSFEKFKEASLYVYNTVLFGSGKGLAMKSDGTVKINGFSRGAASFIYSEKEILMNFFAQSQSQSDVKKVKDEHGSLPDGSDAADQKTNKREKKEISSEDAEVIQGLEMMFRQSGIFPIANELNTAMRFSSNRDVFAKIASYETLQAVRKSEEENWISYRDEMVKNDPVFYECLCLVEELRGIDVISFEKSNLKSLILTLKGRPMRTKGGRIKKNKDGGVSHERGLCETIMEDYDEFYVFDENKNETLDGYNANILNVLQKHRGALSKIMQDKYSDIFLEKYFWYKPIINTSGFCNIGERHRSKWRNKSVSIHLGNNYLPFQFIKDDDGGYSLILNSLTQDRKDKITLKLKKSLRLSDDTIIDELPNKAGYFYEYTNDRQNKTRYSGLIKEPTLRIVWGFNKRGKFETKLLLDLAISSHRESGVELDPHFNATRSFFLTASPCTASAMHAFRKVNMAVYNGEYDTQ